jgi:tRNA 2-thiouridine synthesizing protein E
MQGNSEMPARDAEGYLVEPTEWNEAVATALAREQDIELGDDHWDAIRFMRQYYDKHQVAADARHVIKHMEQRYPGQACKIAGMRRPRGWSSG